MNSLRELASWLQSADDEQLSMKTICLRAPWNADAEARLVQVDSESRLPADALAEGMKYFLEASVAREVLDVLRARPTKSSTDDACRLLLHYAENDAYPDWVYKRR
jgi:hypothetical protein